MYKYADDMVLVGLIQAGNTGNQSAYFNCIEELINWDNDSAFFINKWKTKKMVIMKQQNFYHDLIPVVINNQLSLNIRQRSLNI